MLVRKRTMDGFRKISMAPNRLNSILSSRNEEVEIGTGMQGGHPALVLGSCELSVPFGYGFSGHGSFWLFLLFFL